MEGVLIETDLIVDYLTAAGPEPSLLRLLLATTTCFTTFLQAAEIIAAAHGDEERRTVDRALYGLKILGASGRYAATIAGRLASSPSRDYRTAIVAAMAIESRIPIVTDRYLAHYAAGGGLRVIEGAALAGDPATFAERYALCIDASLR